MIKILFSFIVLSTVNSYAYKGKYFNQTDPKGWINQPADGFNYAFLASVAFGQQAPIFTSMTLEKDLSKENKKSFLEKSLKSGFIDKTNFNFLPANAPKSVNLSVNFQYVLKEFSYNENGKPFKGLALIISHNKVYHYFQFTASSDSYSFYLKDIVQSLESIKIL